MGGSVIRRTGCAYPLEKFLVQSLKIDSSFVRNFLLVGIGEAEELKVVFFPKTQQDVIER